MRRACWHLRVFGAGKPGDLVAPASPPQGARSGGRTAKGSAASVETPHRIGSGPEDSGEEKRDYSIP